MQPTRALQLEQLAMEQYYLLNIMEDAVMKLRLSTLKIMLLVTVISINLAKFIEMTVTSNIIFRVLNLNFITASSIIFSK